VLGGPGLFISKHGERGLPLCKLLKKTSRFECTGEADQVFQELKRYLTSPPVLLAPRDEEELLCTLQVVSVVLVAEREERNQKTRVTESEAHPGVSATDPGGSTLDLGANALDPKITPEDASAGVRRVQHPVYFVSEVLRDAKEHYP
jgi:hypothetical protein